MTFEAQRRQRVETLARRLQHPDPSQLLFQMAEIAGDQTYLRHGITAGPGDVVLDVGANVGVAAVFFAVLCGVAQVHCFEPVAPVCAILRENVAALSACVVHEHGLGSRPGRVPITYYPGAAAMSGLYADPIRDCALVRAVLINRGLSESEADDQLAGRYQSERLSCEIRTLSGALREHQIEFVDLLKIDVERAELDVLGGIEGRDWPRIGQIVMEVHDDDGRGQATADALVRRGFRVTRDQEDAMHGTSVEMLYATRP
ncbi:MAG: FkbM family methyltransferase [Solirubrobacteraceae bacterium]